MKTAKETKMAGGEKSALRMQSILVPIDFSEPSAKALNYAAALADKFGAKLTLLFVIEPLGAPDFMRSFPLIMENAELHATCKSKLMKFARKALIKAGLIEKVLVRDGRPHHEITEAARTLKVDAIVIATHGYSGVTHAFMGSVAERVVRHAPCPVVVVREGQKA